MDAIRNDIKDYIGHFDFTEICAFSRLFPILKQQLVAELDLAGQRRMLSPQLSASCFQQLLIFGGVVKQIVQ